MTPRSMVYSFRRSTILIEAGKALYGERWQSELARELGVADRTMRRWAAGTSEVPDGLGKDLLRLVEDRGRRLQQLAVLLNQTDEWAAARGE